MLDPSSFYRLYFQKLTCTGKLIRADHTPKIIRPKLYAQDHTPKTILLQSYAHNPTPTIIRPQSYAQLEGQDGIIISVLVESSTRGDISACMEV